MRLEAIDDYIWLAEGPILDFYGFAYPTRMVIVKLPDGALWVWSPITLDEGLQREVEQLGPVAHLVSPNALHHLYLSAWHEKWLSARLWGPASTIRKRDDLPFEAPLEDTPPDDWQGVFTQAWFRGSFFLDEVVFVHTPTGTAIFADLSENFSRSFLKRHWKGWQRAIAKIWGIVEGRGYAPLEWRLSWWARGPARAALAKVCAAHPRRVVMAHGTWIDEGGEAYLRQAFAWLLKKQDSGS